MPLVWPIILCCTALTIIGLILQYTLFVIPSRLSPCYLKQVSNLSCFFFQTTVATQQAANANTAPVWTVSATVTTATVARVATCPMRTSASTDPAMSLLTAPTHWEATSARAGKATPETDIIVMTSMSVKTHSWPASKYLKDIHKNKSFVLQSLIFLV